MAEQVTLKSSDGTVNLVGDLVLFDGETFIIRTDLGDLRIAANRVVCEGPGCPDAKIKEADGDVVFAGSATIGEGLMPLLMQGFGTYMNASVEVETTAVQGEFVATVVGEQGFGDPIGTYAVKPTGSGDAFPALKDGVAEIGMSSRRITVDEARALKDAGIGDMVDPGQEHILAVDSLVIIVNNSNPIQELTVGQLAAIYSGQVTNWRDIGGSDTPITVVGQNEESGTYDVFQDGVFEGRPPSMPSGAVVAENSESAAALVNDNPGAIAYVGYAFQRGQKAMPLVSACGIGTAPDAFSVKVEEYALFRRLYLYTRSDASDLTKSFIEFTKSPEANTVIAQAGFVDLGIESQALAGSARMMRVKADGDAASSFVAGVTTDILALMEGAERLSATFRFRTGSSKLDPRGVLDLALLADYLESQPAGTTVTLVGFSDEVGEFEPNLRLSKNRAQQVADDLMALAGDRLKHITFKTAGFGEVSPASCNTSDLGRSINRRVETWITKG